jgi:alpha-tubulin suppressor-like RCC1 family protein
MRAHRRYRGSAFYFGLVAAAWGCGNETESPTGPTLPASATVAALVFEQLSAGREYTCGVTSDDRAFCWGRNANGQLGDGTTTSRLTPVAVAGALRFRQISAGFYTTCGVTTDRRAYCWGLNESGQLGNGTTTQRLRPVAVAGEKRFRQLDTNLEHTCGVTYPANLAYCWGSNRRGEIGDGTTTRRLRPVPVAGSLQFQQVTAGWNHSCGLTSSQLVFCWGMNREGQVGDGSQTWRKVKPTKVSGNRQYRSVDAGANHTCAVTTGLRAFCWGEDALGVLGNGEANGSSTVPKGVVGGLSFERVSAGLYVTCAETPLNQVYCWGANAVGSLGDGTTTNSQSPVAVIGGHSFSQVSTNDLHSCGRTPAGVGYCWGSGFLGELGNGETSNSSTPVPVAGG